MTRETKRDKGRGGGIKTNRDREWLGRERKDIER